MAFFDIFSKDKEPSSASVAKERLKVIVAHERRARSAPDYLPALQKRHSCCHSKIRRDRNRTIADRSER